MKQWGRRWGESERQRRCGSEQASDGLAALLLRCGEGDESARSPKTKNSEILSAERATRDGNDRRRRDTRYEIRDEDDYCLSCF